MALPDRLIDLAPHHDSRGSLVAIEGGRDVPFDIARVYYLFGSVGSPRGFHAHRELRQLMICVAGSCHVTLDDGKARAKYLLDAPDKALAIDPITWREISDMSADSCLLVIASAPFDESDYIADYETFLKLVRSAG